MFPVIKTDIDPAIRFFYEPNSLQTQEWYKQQGMDAEKASLAGFLIVYAMRCGRCVTRPYNETVMIYSSVAYCMHCQKQLKGTGSSPIISIKNLSNSVHAPKPIKDLTSALNMRENPFKKTIDIRSLRPQRR